MTGISSSASCSDSSSPSWVRRELTAGAKRMRDVQHKCMMIGRRCSRMLSDCSLLEKALSGMRVRQLRND